MPRQALVHIRWDACSYTCYLEDRFIVWEIPICCSGPFIPALVFPVSQLARFWVCALKKQADHERALIMLSVGRSVIQIVSCPPRVVTYYKASFIIMHRSSVSVPVNVLSGRHVAQPIVFARAMKNFLARFRPGISRALGSATAPSKGRRRGARKKCPSSSEPPS